MLPIPNPEHDTNPDKPKYRPPFLDHFDRKKTETPQILPDVEAAAINAAAAQLQSSVQQPPAQHVDAIVNVAVAPSAPSLLSIQAQEERQRYQSHLQLQLNQISAANQMGVQHLMHGGAPNEVITPRAPEGQPKYQRNFVDGEFEFVSVNANKLLHLIKSD